VSVDVPDVADLGDVHLAYTVDGPGDGAALLLIRGLGTQMSEWPAARTRRGRSRAPASR
jgi:hypothetical protein